MVSSNQIPYQKMVDDTNALNNSINSILPLSMELQTLNSPEMYSNRTKAIICINIFTVLQFLFMVGSKSVMATYNISGLDYVFVRTIACLFVHSTSMLAIF